ncbi:Ca(2+)-dependent cysteine protease [Actinomortierella ambigua]|uniref:Ca(2+)-dependent cysteine protease n=1 Tax=Actinomortierella ambigua TaxID=1343610 RepID=A0A9P6QKL6_9FUNG|nr:Ca(2+)-dependent cysteine protease [Actinomortierella ambigua]
MSLPFSPSKPDIASASSSSLALSKKTTLDKPQSQNAAIEDLGIIVSSMNGRIEPPEYTVFETTEVHTSKTGNIISRTINTTRRENIRQTTTYRLPEEKTTVSQIAATRPSIASVPLTTTTTPPPAPAAPAESTAKVPIIAPLTSNNLAALTLTLSGSNATEPQYKFAIVPDSAAKPETAPKCPPLTGTSTQPNRALPTISTKPVNVEAQSTARLHGIPPSDALKSLGKLPPLPPPAFYSVSKPQDVIIHTIIPSNPGATNSSRHYVITPTDAAAQLDLLSLTSSPSAEPKSTSQPIEATSKVTELDAASIISSIASCLVDPRARRRAAPLYTRSTIFDVRVANNTGCESGAKHSEVQSDYQSSASSVLGSDPNVQATRQDPRVRNHPRPASVRNRKRCLLIGIDYAGKEYALYPSQANSEVASNGRRRRSALYYLNSIGAFLARRQNWESFECMVLSDEPNASTDDLPTRKNILIGMQWLVHEAMEGDTLLVYFVGQGGPASMFHRFQSLQPIVKVHSSDTEILIPLDIEECNSPILSVTP